MKTIVTHSSNFHADELFGTAALIAYNKKKFPKDTIKVIRSLDPKVWEKADFLLDIGGVYAPAKNRFDHHQRGGAGQHGNSIPYAAFGLVWKKFGKAISGSQKAADYVEKKLVMALDGDDNGNMMYEPVIDDILPVTLEEYVTLERGIEKNRTGMKDLNSLDKKFNKPNIALGLV